MLRDGLSSSSSRGAAADESCGGKDYIEHRVSNLDTLAGVAIKYGVEVADIKRANGLATDLHMFGHQILKVPVPGRHVKHVPSRLAQHLGSSSPAKRNVKISGGPLQLPGISQTEKKPLSSAMNLLRGYYGLSSPIQPSSFNAEGMELTSFRVEGEDFSEDEPLSPMTPASTSGNNKRLVENGKTPAIVSTDRPISRLSREFTPESPSVPSFGLGAVDRSSEPSVRRRSKVEGSSPLIGASEIESRQDTVSVEEQLQSSHGLPNGPDAKAPGFLRSLDGALVTGKSKDESISRVFKSMSTSNLQDQPSMQANLSSTKYTSKMDVRSGNHVQAISRSLFEGLSKPALPRYKEALD
ncbi:hypothetical protein L7F22_052423 [Adiantum nelumboides]|nr:hypothetical protein [Adiantum nelumboides]MCO5598330.1 hypothetical protein [Adiantum nelumboides]